MKRFTIGVLINQFEGMYQVPIWKSIVKKARKLNINVIFFAGKSPDSPANFELYENVVYELTHVNFLDGLIFTSGVLINDIGEKEFLKFFNYYRKEIPKISITVPIKGIPSIVINNKKAMKEIVLHLIKEHNCKRIAYISGPETHPDAIGRFNGYREALTENGIDFDENLILPGDFRIDSGREAVRTLIYERKIFPDAIVAANDTMALAAYEELKKKGFQIPADILLTGFDDQKDVQFTEPPLTTVKQPLEKEGEVAVELIYRMLMGENVPELTVLDCQLIVRQSCGCISPKKVKDKKFLQNAPNLENILTDYIKSLNIDLQENSNKIFDKTIELILSFIEKKIDGDSFLSNLNNLIISINGDEDYLYLLYEVFDFLISISETAKIDWALHFWEKASILVTYAMKRVEGREKLELDFLMQTLRNFAQNIYCITDFSELKKAMRNFFSIFGIKFFSMILFDKSPERISRTKWKLPDKSLISFIYNASSREFKENIELPTKDFFPKELLPENLFYLGVLTIYNRERHFGYIVLNLDPYVSELLYVYLQENLGLSMRIISLWEEQRKSREELELANSELERFNIELKNLAEIDALTGLYNRRGFFEIADRMLNTAKDKCYEMEVFFIDLDNLKMINDNLGHIEGDEALKNAANILKRCFRKSDLVARVGGDEFVAIALKKKKSEKMTVLILKRLDNELKKYNSLSKKPYLLSLSVGFQSFNPFEVISIEHMLTIVDEKLYIEKKRKKSFRE
ncbi:MAG: diguanylate cyclase [Brevinematia bacterium]